MLTDEENQAVALIAPPVIFMTRNSSSRPFRGAAAELMLGGEKARHGSTA